MDSILELRMPRSYFAHLEVWNMESMPNSDAAAPSNTLLNFVFVGTVGSSLAALCKTTRRLAYIILRVFREALLTVFGAAD